MQVSGCFCNPQGSAQGILHALICLAWEVKQVFPSWQSFPEFLGLLLLCQLFTHFLLTGEMPWEHLLLPSLMSAKQPQTQTTSPSNWVNVSLGSSGTSQASRNFQPTTLAPSRHQLSPAKTLSFFHGAHLDLLLPVYSTLTQEK